MSDDAIRVLAAGMVGSGSTFLFNIVREILNSGAQMPALATYSDEWNPFFGSAPRLVIKSHWGIRALAPLAERGMLLPVVSVRHPGDCVCSDMERFGYDFAFAVRRVAVSLRFCTILRPMRDTILYRYEDNFTSDPRTAAGLAQALGIQVGPERLADIHARYDAAGTRAYASQLDRLPDLMRSMDSPNDAWCPTTQIHRGHIGKMTSGRWHDLSDAQRRAIGEMCGADALSFGYDCAS